MTELSQVNFDKLRVSCENCSLRELCLPRGMSGSDLVRINEIIERKKPVQKNDFLFRAGDNNRALYAVLAGSVKTVVDAPNGDEQIVGFHFPGELLGLDGFQGDTHSCSAVALETASICEIPLDKLDIVCHQVPSIQGEIRRIMGRELSEDHAMMLLLGRMNAEEKLASFLMNISRRMEERHRKASEFILPMPRQDIANFLGLAVETVSRLFARFQEDGVISVDRRRVNIINMDALKSTVDENKMLSKQQQA
jgi:CRP/FNR family transcriptional regulator